MIFDWRTWYDIKSFFSNNFKMKDKPKKKVETWYVSHEVKYIFKPSRRNVGMNEKPSKITQKSFKLQSNFGIWNFQCV